MLRASCSLGMRSTKPARFKSFETMGHGARGHHQGREQRCRTQAVGAPARRSVASMSNSQRFKSNFAKFASRRCPSNAAQRLMRPMGPIGLASRSGRCAPIAGGWHPRHRKDVLQFPAHMSRLQGNLSWYPFYLDAKINDRASLDLITALARLRVDGHCTVIWGSTYIVTSELLPPDRPSRPRSSGCCRQAAARIAAAPVSGSVSNGCASWS